MIYLLVGILSICFLVYKFTRPQNYWTQRNVKQEAQVYFLGDNWRLLFRLESLAEYIHKLYFKYFNERYYGVCSAMEPILVIRDIELVRQIGAKDFEHFLNHRSFDSDSEVDAIWNKNLFSLKGQQWKNMRQTLSPSFTTSKMRAMFSLMKQSGKQYVDFYLKQEKDLIPLEMKDSVTRFANDVIANCAFGINCDSLHERDNQFYLNSKKFSSFLGFKKMFKFFLFALSPKLFKFLNLTMMDAKVTEYFKNIVKENIDYRERHKIIRPDMINLLMEAKKGQLKYEEEKNAKSAGYATVEESHIGQATNDNQITEITDMDMTAQVAIFLLAGFETISSVITWMSYSLAVNSNVQQKLIAEIDQIFKETDDNLSYDVLARMKYMDMVISEALRMFPALLAVDRVCNKPYVIEPVRDGETPVHLNVGDTIWIPTYGIHYDPQYYPDPHKFIPERFSDDNKANIKPYTFLPFGIGPRNCIGSRFALMEMKTFFYHLLRQFEIVVTEKTQIPIKFAKDSFNLQMDGGCHIALKKRLQN